MTATAFAVAEVTEEGGLVDIYPILADEARERWPEVEHFVDMAMQHSYGDMTTKDVLERVASGNLLMLVAMVGDEIRACFCLELVERFTGKTCHCMILAGSGIDDWIDTWMACWREVALQYGCDRLTIKGRPGWARYAKHKFGFKHLYTVMSLDIDEGKQ